jgi:PadR family transcriptional regulator PadR
MGGRFVEPFLLLLLAEGPSHGYDLMERLTTRGFVAGEVDPGYLYRTLRGMEAAGVVASEWDSASRGPIKRTYALTPAGERALHGWADHLEAHRRSLERFLGAYRARFPATPTPVEAPSSPAASPGAPGTNEDNREDS